MGWLEGAGSRSSACNSGHLVRPNFNLVTATNLDLKSYYKEIQHYLMWWPMCVKQAHYCTALLNKTYLFTIWKGKKKTARSQQKERPTALLLIIFLFVQPEARSSSCGFVEGKVHARKGDGATESSQPGKHTATNIKPTIPKFQLVSLYWYFDLWFKFNSEVDFSEEAAWRTAQLSILYHMRTRSLMAAFEMELKTEQSTVNKLE